MRCEHNYKIKYSCIEHVPIFSSLSEEEMREVEEISRSKKYAKGQFIYSAGDRGGALFILYCGRVKIFRVNPAGKEQVISLVGPGEFIGELSLFSSLPNSDNAQALEDTTMCVLQADDIKNLMAKYPSIAFKVLDVLSRRLEHAERTIESISLNSVGNRLIKYLLDTAQKDIVTLPMTKGDLASLLGTTQETLSRKLAEFSEEGLIALEGHRKIIIKDKDRLVAAFTEE